MEWGKAKEEVVKWIKRIQEKGGVEEAEKAREALKEWP
jgi:hypothetical protein